MIATYRRPCHLRISAAASAALFGAAYMTLPRRRPAHSQAALAGQNIIEKIVQRYVVGTSPSPSALAAKVRQGDFVAIRPHKVMTHDNTGAVLSKFKSIGAPSFFDPKQAVFTLDHDVQNKSAKNLAKYQAIEDFARLHNVDFYPAGRGIGHQIMVEEGYALPNTLVVASDSHSNMYGGIGCLGTPVVRTDAAAIWATGQTWWQLPPVVRVELENSLPSHASGKDVIVALCGLFANDDVLNCAIEFTGSGVASLSIDDRLTIANMTTEWGALAGVFPADNVTRDWLVSRADDLRARASRSRSLSSQHPQQLHSRLNRDTIDRIFENPLVSDGNAHYTKILTLDLSTVSPFVSGPNSVKIATPLAELEQKKIKINKAYLVSCVNSRLSDIAAAAAVLRDTKVAPGVEFYIAAASSQVQEHAEKNGDWDTLIRAGAKPLMAGCGPCIGLGAGLLEDGEVGISATNRNYKGRMGSPNAQAYLASPAVVAASAAAGYICGPNKLPQSIPISLPKTSIKILAPPKQDPSSPESASTAAAAADVVPGFPATHQGRLVFCNADNLNTDGIYPGKYTYNDDMTPAQMAHVVMENYDPDFAKSVKQNDVLIGGFNFGTGSSREQAATALLHAGIRVVIAGSFSETFKRNAINNGLLVLECSDLVHDLRNGAIHGQQVDKSATIYSNLFVRLHLVSGLMEIGLENDQNVRRYAIPRVGIAAQELVVAGGLENWVKHRIASRQ
eukprot:jgi/Hompol1/6623/HPOL_002288-RA